MNNELKIHTNWIYISVSLHYHFRRINSRTDDNTLEFERLCNFAQKLAEKRMPIPESGEFAMAWAQP